MQRRPAQPIPVSGLSVRGLNTPATHDQATQTIPRWSLEFFALASLALQAGLAQEQPDCWQRRAGVVGADLPSEVAVSHILIAPGTTYCEDTPQNWREFERKKLALQCGGPQSKRYQKQLRQAHYDRAHGLETSSDAYRQNRLPDGSYGKGSLK